jgi:hypothetical protein
MKMLYYGGRIEQSGEIGEEFGGLRFLGRGSARAGY